MKKTLLILLLLCLLLSACTPVPVAETTREAPTEPTLTAVPTERPTQASTDTTTEPVPTEPPVTEPVTEPAGYRASGSRTSGGVLVYTDPSAYVPYDGSGAKYTRLREGPLDRFEPSEDYGAVYPYETAELIAVNEYPEFGSETKFVYGFVDRTGRILTDGIYRNVWSLNYLDGDASPCAYWLVSQTARFDAASLASKDETGTRGEPTYQYGLISTDGSRKLECRYTGIRDLGCGILCRNSDEMFDFTVLSYDLVPVFTGRELFGDVECSGWDLQYSEGLLLAMTYTMADAQSYYVYYNEFEDEAVFWFCDENGNRLFGPYARACPFTEGLACVSVDGEHFGYIDKTGAWVIEPIYASAESFQDGCVVQHTADDQSVALDAEGNVIFQTDVSWFYQDDCGYASSEWVSEKDTYHYTYFDHSGNFLMEGDNLRCLDETTFYTFDAREKYFRFLTPDRVLLTVEAQTSYPMKGAAMRDGELLFGWYVGWNDDYSTRYFVPEDISEALEIPWPASPTENDNIYDLDPIDSVTGETWYFHWTGTSWEGRTETGDRITVPLRCGCPSPAGELVRARTAQASWLLTHDGQVVFCFPIDTGD